MLPPRQTKHPDRSLLDRLWHPRHGVWGEGPALMILGTLTGLLTGFGALGFHYLLAGIHNLALLGRWSVVNPPLHYMPTSPWGWALPVVPVLGALLVIFLSRHYTPEIQGAGVSQVLAALHQSGGRIHRILAILRPVATAITIGTGGSAGKEGPAMQFGAAITAWLDAALHLPEHRRIHLLGCGVGAGIAAVFNAPLGGWFFAMEIIVPDWRPWTILSTLLATVASSWVTQHFLGDFHLLPQVSLHLPHDVIGLAMFLPLAALCAGVAVVFMTTLSGFTRHSQQWLPNPYLRHGLGMAILGLLLLLTKVWTGHYLLIGGSYAGMAGILQGQFPAWWVLLGLLALKILATDLTIGSGGSGGIFSPSLFIGAAAGALCAHALSPWLHQGYWLPLFTLCGMAGLVSANTGALLSAPVMVVEITGSSEVLLPAMLTSVAAFAIRRLFLQQSIYTLPLLAEGLNVPENHYIATTSDDPRDQ